MLSSIGRLCLAEKEVEDYDEQSGLSRRIVTLH